MNNAKKALLIALDEYIAKNEFGGVYEQQNAIFARRDIKPQIEALSEEEAAKVKALIDEKQAYDPSNDKFGFGPVTISPTDYASFIKPALETK